MEMIWGQLAYFGASFLWGAALMFVYDFVEVFRRKVKHGKVARLIEDWLFWLIASILVFQMIFALNNGIIRSFFILSFFAGMLLYRKLVKDRVVRFVLYVIYTIFRPYVWILKKIHKKQKEKAKKP